MSRLPDTGPSLRRYLERAKRQAIREGNASSYNRSGTSVTAENEVTVDGAFIVNGPLTATQTADITGTTHIGGATDIDGTLNVDASTTIGGTLGVTGVTTLGAPTDITGTLDVTGDATFGGAVAITGTLSLPAGIIDNSALTNPLVTANNQNGLTNYAITTTSTVRASVTFTVPADFTIANVITTATAMGFNNSGGGDYLYVQSVIHGTNGGELYSYAGAGLGVGVSVPFNKVLTGLMGGQVITVSVATRAGLSTWTATASNQANIYAFLIFAR